MWPICRFPFIIIIINYYYYYYYYCFNFFPGCTFAINLVIRDFHKYILLCTQLKLRHSFQRKSSALLTLGSRLCLRDQTVAGLKGWNFATTNPRWPTADENNARMGSAGQVDVGPETGRQTVSGHALAGGVRLHGDVWRRSVFRDVGGTRKCRPQIWNLSRGSLQISPSLRSRTLACSHDAWNLSRGSDRRGWRQKRGGHVGGPRQGAVHLECERSEVRVQGHCFWSFTFCREL